MLVEQSCFENLPKDLLPLFFYKLDFLEIRSLSEVCKLFNLFIKNDTQLWLHLAEQNNLFNFEKLSVIKIKQELILKNTPWLKELPLLLINAFGGTANVYKLKILESKDVKNIFFINPDQMSEDYMRGCLDGRLFVAYKYQTKEGEKFVEVFAQTPNHEDREDWNCTTYYNLFGEIKNGCYMPEFHFNNLKRFYETGETEIEIINGLTREIFRIQPSQKAEDSLQKRNKRSYKNCIIS